MLLACNKYQVTTLTFSIQWETSAVIDSDLEPELCLSYMFLTKKMFSTDCIAAISLAGPHSMLSAADPGSVSAAYVIELSSFPKGYSAAK